MVVTFHALIAVVAAGAQAQPAPLALRHDRERIRHDALRYDAWIRLADSGNVFAAKVTTRWRLVGRGPIRINLDQSYRIESLTLDGRPAQYRRVNHDLLEVSLPTRISNQTTTTITYRGSPPPFERAGRKSGQDDGLVQRGQGVTRTIFADNWPNRARRWLATQDHPSDKAVIDWTIEAPAGLTVVANGVEGPRDTLAGGLVRWRFSMAQPIPVATMVLGAARLAVTKQRAASCGVKCIPVSIYTYPEDSAWAAEGPFRQAPEMIEYFERLFGPFPYDELRHVQTSTIFGGMENATAIFYDEGSYPSKASSPERRLREGTVAHETAHQWFGDAATQSDWHHLWLSEGFATYAAALWQGQVGGDSGFRAAVRGLRSAVVSSNVVDRPIIDPEATDLLGLLNPNNYPKGAMVLHSARGLMGDSAFFRAVRRYYANARHGNALSSDLARVFSREAGVDMTWYFSQALTQPGYPIISLTNRVEGGHLVIELAQVQKPAWGQFRLPNLELRVGDRTITVPMMGRRARAVTHWDGDSPPTVEVDPNGWWLLEVK